MKLTHAPGHQILRSATWRVLALLFTLCLPGAQAASITGKVGVGTWNTQAEFTDIKVVQNTTTLYQSNFTTGMAGWTTLNGTWATASGNLRQTESGSPALAFLDSINTDNLTITLKARKISGDEGFLIAFGSPGDTTESWWNLGGWGNTKHALQAPGVSASEVGGTVTTGVWYDITAMNARRDSTN